MLLYTESFLCLQTVSCALLLLIREEDEVLNMFFIDVCWPVTTQL